MVSVEGPPGENASAPRSRSFAFPVEYGHIVAFARAIGDPNPIYEDEAYARSKGFKGVLAPPTFTRANVCFDPEYDNRPTVGERWHGSGREPTGSNRTRPLSVAAEEHYEFFDDIYAGDLLTCEVAAGATWEKAGRRGGTLVFTEIIRRFTRPDGQLVAIARQVKVAPQRAPIASSQRG